MTASITASTAKATEATEASTHDLTTGPTTATDKDVEQFLSPGRAARALELKRGELTLAIQLGYVRTTGAERTDDRPDDRRTDGVAPAARSVPRSEVDRLRAADGFPDTLRERVTLVGTTAGAALMGITKDRFTKLARVGLLTPAKFYLNRYRAVVWLYLADDVRQFADAHPALLTGRTPEDMRRELNAGEDKRARNWRGRRAGQLLRLAEGPWQRAGVLAAMLDPVQIAELVPDPYERSYLHRLRPEPTFNPAGPFPAAESIAARVLFADDPDEISWLRSSLTAELAEARHTTPAPRPRATPPTPGPRATPPVPSPRATAPASHGKVPTPGHRTGGTALSQPTRPLVARPAEAYPPPPRGLLGRLIRGPRGRPRGG
ncbi:DUF6397 family protein [Streptomyces sp. NPDC002851]